MTLCIAAACRDKGKNKIVIASDWKAGSEVAVAEIQDKLYWITPFWPALVAGSVSKALELVHTYRDLLIEGTLAGVLETPQTTFAAMKMGAQRQKQKFANDHMMRSLGITYEHFLTNGKAQLDEGVFRRYLHEIDEIDLECYLIIPIFVGGTEFLFKINRDATVEHCENFVAIGAGDTVAEAALFYRKHECTAPLGRTIYNVFEAMTQGGMIAPEVGKDITISVLSARTEMDKHLPMEELNDPAHQFLAKQYKRYGPKRLNQHYKFKRERFLDPIEWDEDEGKTP